MKNDWSQFLRNLASLIKVKTIITLVVIAVFATLALNGTLEPDVVMTVVMMVVAFYFGTQKERQDNSGNGGSTASVSAPNPPVEPSSNLPIRPVSDSLLKVASENAAAVPEAEKMSAFTEAKGE